MIEVLATTEKGGAVNLNKDHGVWASYAVMTVAGTPPAEILIARIKLKDGRPVQFFVNRDSNLVVVNVIDKNGNGGREIVRVTL